SRLGDATRAERPMHPHVLNAEIGALAHGRLGGLGSSSDHDPVNATGYRFQIVVAGIAFDVVGIRVDGEDLVAPLPQTLVHNVAAVSLGFPRHAGHSDSLLCEELGCGFLHLLHFCSPFQTGRRRAVLDSFQSRFDVGQIALEHGLHTKTQQWCRQPEKAMRLDLHWHDDIEKCICYGTIVSHNPQFQPEGL
ncbi:MAG TPA: hypothetical protein VEL31_26415, partial [Ktedonobacteraceae bacterium]|nr:hypothetical protein [Ktedonobacteraceae bacterium]